MMGEIEQLSHPSNTKTSYVRGVENLILLKSPYYPKQSRLNVIRNNIPVTFQDTRKGNPKIQMEIKSLNRQSNLKEKDKTLFITIHDFFRQWKRFSSGISAA